MKQKSVQGWFNKHGLNMVFTKPRCKTLLKAQVFMSVLQSWENYFPLGTEPSQQLSKLLPFKQSTQNHNFINSSCAGFFAILSGWVDIFGKGRWPANVRWWLLCVSTWDDGPSGVGLPAPCDAKAQKLDQIRSCLLVMIILIHLKSIDYLLGKGGSLIDYLIF